MQVATNGLLKSIEHRVMTNSRLARTSVATFIMPTPDCLIGPGDEFISEENPPCYRTTMFRDFMRIYNVVKLGSSLNLTTDLKNVQKII
jgi:2'-deoxymugineic-acid 2'-dioxygenase/mugineic-acid 3-dioxygenase